MNTSPRADHQSANLEANSTAGPAPTSRILNHGLNTHIDTNAFVIFPFKEAYKKIYRNVFAFLMAQFVSIYLGYGNFFLYAG
jgi:hypothetical protein